jgi:multidrug transporter EmrE-like cation transporter
MTLGTVALILISVTLSAFAQVSFKMGVGARGVSTTASDTQPLEAALIMIMNPGVLGGLLLYGLGTLLWLQVLARTDLAQAYPFVGLGFVITALFGAVLFGEPITFMRAGGILLVIVGICAIARS